MTGKRTPTNAGSGGIGGGRRRGGASGPAPPAGFSEARAAEMILAGDFPPEDWWPFITALDLSGEYGKRRDFADLGPLDRLPNLRTLNCSWTQVSSLEPPRAITGLQALNCWGTQVSSLEPLRAITGLQTLNCYRTQVSSLEPLRAITARHPPCQQQ